MEEKNRKIGFVVSAEDDTKTAFQNIKTGAADMASSVAKSGEQAAKGVKGIGDGADEAAQKMARAESAMAQALQRATEKAKIAAQAGDSLSRAFEQKIEMRGLDASKLNPLVAKLREAEDALASFKAQQARDAGQSSFLESLRAQTDALGKTKSELLALQAAQLGVASQAAPYIAKLRETEASMGKVGVSAAQTAAAMRMVPAQFTDIVVSLQSGQEPLTVLLQQGGQLKDMFGGAGAAARGLASYVVGLVNPFTVAAAAVATLGVAYYQGSKETDAFRTALVLSGNQAGTTVDELNAMARTIASVSGTQGAAAAGLAEMARYSKVGADQLKDFTAVALAWEKTTGQAVGETAKQFAELAKDPLQASLALNEQMNHLTASVYDQIKALEKQGKTSEAAAVAQKAYADAMKTGADELTQNLGYIEQAVQVVTGSAKKMWDAILGVGRKSSPTDQAAKELERLQKELTDKIAAGPKNDLPEMRASYDKGVEDLKRRIQQASEFLKFAGAAGKSIAEAQTVSKDYIDATEEFDKIAGQFASKEVKRKRELTVAENLYNSAVEKTEKAFANTPELSAKLAKLKSDYDNTVAGINKRFTEKASGGVSISDNQLAGLESQLAAAKQYREQLLTLGAAASDLNAGERESLKLAAQIEMATNAKTRAKLQEAKALADALGLQLRSNDGLEKSQKAHAAIIADNYKAADSIVERAREQEAANSVYGKGRTEIERMTLAMLENQMAEAQGSDRFDPKYIASLEAKIAAQKRWVAALGDADYKQLDDRLTKSLEASKEALAIQQDGLSLLGLDELQRKKLVAQRRIELDLAKELLLIEKSKFSDDPIENLIAQQALKGKAREKAEIDTQTALLRIQEEYVNKQVDQYDEVFRKGFADMLNNGKDGWDSFTKSLTTTFKTTVADQIYKMFLRPFVVQVVASLAGVDAKGGVASALGLGGSSGGLLGSLSNGSSIYSLLSGESFVGSLAKSAGSLLGLGSAASGLGLTAGVGSGLTLASTSAGLGLTGATGTGLSLAGGGGLGLSASAGALGGSAGGLTGALAAIPGWGWALAGGALLLGSMDFGSRGANHTGGAYSTSTGDRNVAASQALGSDAWGNALGDITQRANTALDAQLGKTVDALSGVYTSLAKYAGSSAKQIDIAAAFAVNPAHGDEDNYGYFRLIDKISGQALSTYKARDGVLGTDPQAAYTKFVGEMGGALIEQLKAADIPGWMRSIFDGLGSDITVDGLNKALQAIAAVDSAFKGWADTLQGFSGLSAEVQTALLNTSGGLDALAGNVNAFYSGFYSEAERMGILQRQVLQQLANLDVSVDTSSAEAAKESFRRTVEGALDAGNAELAAKLLAMSGSFATAADYAAKAAEQAVQAASQAMESLLKDRRQLEAELLKAQGNTSGYAAAMRAIATEGYTPAEVAAYDYNAALRDQIDAMTAATAAAERAASERTGLETRLLTLQGDTAALRQRELAALDASNRALQQHIWAIEDAQAAYTAATTAAQGAYSGLERSVGAQKSVLQEQYNTQKAALQQQANAAKEAWQAQVSAAQTAASEMRSIASMLGNAFDNVQIQSPALSMARLQSAQSLIIGARDRNDVRVAGLDEALQVASGDTAKMYGKWEEWAFQQGVTAAAVGDLYGEAQKQLSTQEQLIAQLQASDVVAKAISDAEIAKTDAWYQQELGVLDATLETGKSQLNALLGIDDSVLSVADAVAKLGLSINAAEAARQSAEAARAASAAYASASGGGGGGAAGPAVSYTDEQLRAMGLDPAAVNAQYNWLKSNGATNAVGPGELVQSMLTSGQAALQGILNTQTNTDKFGNVYKDYADFLGKFTDAQIIQASKIATLPDGVNRDEYLRDILAKSINGSHADGLPYVPFDGYIAELHKGERVMTANENRLYTPNFAAVNSGSGVIESLRAEIATLRTLLAEISANTNATAGWTAATDRKLNRVVRNDAIATTTT